MTITLAQPTVYDYAPGRGGIEVDEEYVPVERIYKVQTYAPSEPGREFNGGDYAGGLLFAVGDDGALYAREWDSSDWDDRHQWGQASPTERADFDRYRAN